MPEQSVLVTDTNEALLVALEKLVTAAGHHVVSCRCFEEARSHLQTHTPSAIVTGVRLGAFNGLHLVSLAKQRTPDLCAVVYSGAEDAGIQQEAVGCGAVFLPKESLAHELLPLLESSLPVPSVVGIKRQQSA